MASSIAQVDPLPLVPATVTTGHSKRRPMRWATARTRSRPISMALGCRLSQYASHSERVCMALLSPHYDGRMSIVLYGITNCDTVKKARAWLGDHGSAYRFHDFKKQGVPTERLDAWIEELGWEKLVNRKGTTWRQLDEATQ